MTNAEYRQALAALALSHAGAARLLGVSKRISFYWQSGKVPIPQAVAMVLDRLVADKIIDAKDQIN